MLVHAGQEHQIRLYLLPHSFLRDGPWLTQLFFVCLVVGWGYHHSNPVRQIFLLFTIYTRDCRETQRCEQKLGISQSHLTNYTRPLILKHCQVLSVLSNRVKSILVWKYQNPKWVLGSQSLSHTSHCPIHQTRHTNLHTWAKKLVYKVLLSLSKLLQSTWTRAAWTKCGTKKVTSSLKIQVKEKV